MKAISKIILVLLSLLLISCLNSVKKSENNSSIGKTNNAVNLYAFIGVKISIEEFDPNLNNKIKEKILDKETGDSLDVIKTQYVMDNAFRCKYKVIKNIFNDLPNDTIEFLAYDHYGKPNFSKRDTVILYISKSKDNSYYFHQKYQYDEVFKDNLGNYYSYPKFESKEDTRYAVKNIKGFEVNFENEKYSLKNLNPDVVKIHYPEKFYKITNDTAIPIKGIYFNELIKLRLKTSFKDL